MHPTPSFPEHKSPEPPKIPSKWTQQHLSLLAGSNNRTTALRPLFLPCYIRNGTGCRETPGQEAKGWQCPAKPAMAGGVESLPSHRALRACGREGERGGDAREERARGRGAGKPRWRPNLPFPRWQPGAHGGVRPPRGSRAALGETESKSPGGGGGGAGRPGGAALAVRESLARALRSPAPGTLAREARAGSPRRPRAAASLLVRRSGDPCRSRNWADRALSTELAGRGLCKMPARKVTPGYPLQICHVL